MISKTVFNDLCFLVFIPLGNLLPITASDEQNKAKWWYVTPEIRLQRLGLPSHWHCLLIGLHTLMKLDATQERLTWQGTKGDVQPKHSKDLRASLWQSTGNLVLLKTTWAWKWTLLHLSLEVVDTLVAACERPQKRVKPCPGTWSKKLLS